MGRGRGVLTATAALAAFLAVLLAGCTERSDPELAPARSLPATAETFLESDATRNQDTRLVRGVHYHHRWSRKGPWAVHLVSADLERCDLQLRVVPAVEQDGRGRKRKRMTVTEMRPSGSVLPVVGVNGDFFMEGGTPLGPEVTAGTRRASSRPALVWTSRRTLWIGSAERNGSVMVFGADTVGGPEHAAARVQVLGGYPELLDAGRPVGDLDTIARPDFAAARHPRTAVGYDNEAALLWLAVVDGRRDRWSAGMTLPELVDLLVALGVDEALNLDGGGSSAMSLRGAEPTANADDPTDSLVFRLANRPSDRGGEREVGNSLWLVEDASGCAG